jgi:hypothetical protein
MDLSNPIKPWENIIWTPEPLFMGEMVFCVASGPSMNKGIADSLQGRRVITVNSSCRLTPWADVLYFTDTGWFYDNRETVKNWPGLVVSMSRAAKRELDDPALNRAVPRLLRVKGIGDPSFPPRLPGMPKRLGFPPVGSMEIQQGRSSGHTAVSLAIAMGASRVVMVGYDMQIVNGREHFHNEYSGPRDLGLYANEYVRGFNGWNEAALASGVEILNATHGSAVTEFPFVDLDEVLKCDQS